MQNYGHYQVGTQRPGSTTGYASAPAVPPPYAAPQGYQSAAPQAQSQWAAPAQSQTPTQQSWTQPQQQAAGGYNPGVYGAMPGGYSQTQQSTTPNPPTYQSQQQDVPPPPPPKPAAFIAASHQHGAQNWVQQGEYGAQQNVGYTTQGQQGGYVQPSGYQGHSTTQQAYSNAAPPPPSQTPSGSYFPSPQTPQAGGRPESTYGADQAGTYSTPTSAVGQHPYTSVLSPNEQNPVYIPPSLTGQGVQSYVPSNTNPVPGVYVPPPPDIPAWQQASHAPLQGGTKFKYTKPAPDPSPYGHDQQATVPGQAQGHYAQQAVHPGQQYGQHQYTAVGQAQQPGPYGQSVQNQYVQGQAHQQGQYGENAQTQQQHHNQTTQQSQYHAPPASHQQPTHDHATQPQTYQQQQASQWQPASLAGQSYAQQQAGIQAPHSAQQQTWQPNHQTQLSGSQGYGQGTEAPKPVNGHTSTTTPGFVNNSSPQSQPVSPIQNQVTPGFNANHTALGRQDSISSIALGAIHGQRVGNRNESPKPLPPKLPTPPPPRDDVTKFSALGMGGPSDWEHFGGGEEVDDEDLFRAKRDGRQGVPVQLDSVEVQSQQVSPPQAQGEWPTPPVQRASVSNRDQYQPTPPPTIQRPAQGFVVGDNPNSQSSQQGSAPKDTVQATTGVHADQNYVVDDAIVAPLRVSRPPSQQNTPAQQHPRHQPPPETNNSFTVQDGEWGQQHATKPNDQHDNVAHVAELKAKDDAFARLREDTEQETADLRSEIEQLRVVIETTKTHAEHERKLLAEQIDSINASTEQAKNNADASIKEKNLTIERWKEDSEGKGDTIKEKDAEIAKLRDELKAKEEAITFERTLADDLKKQLEVKDVEIDNLKQQIQNNQTAESLAKDLKQQLEAERLKEAPKPSPAALVADLDPWYAGSLERYIAMLRSEAQETQVEEKIRVFTGFLKTESSARGLEYHRTPPSVPSHQPHHGDAQSLALPTRDSPAFADSKGLTVQLPPTEPPGEDDIQYSPGGRPMVQHRPTFKSETLGHTQQSVSVSSQSTMVLTPTSSQNDFASQTPTTAQSQNVEQQAQSQYRAYVPPISSQTETLQNTHRQSVSSAAPPVLNPTLSYGSKKDEVFFGASTATSSPSSRPTTGTSVISDVPVPAPLSTQHPHALATNSPLKGDPFEKLSKLLPAKVGMPQPNPQLEAIRKKLSSFSSSFVSLQEFTVPWEKSTSVNRRKNDESRRKRQEESEQQTDQLFNDHEISYADIAVIEDEFKETERKLKADEDKNEYQSYVEMVFDKVYNGLQQQIQDLMDLYFETETLLSMAVSGVKSFEGSDTVITQDCLKVLESLFEKIELRHEKVVEAVAERDKRYKKTEIQPLYAAGNITKMKQVEKHFANAEKEAVQRARSEKAGRVADFVRMVEATIISAVGVEQQEIQEIIAAVRDLPSSSDTEKLRTRAKETVLALGDSSKSLLMLLNDIEIDIGGSVLEAELAEAKAEKQPDKVAQLEKQISDRENLLKQELERKEKVLDQDRQEIDRVVSIEGSKAAEGGGVELSEEELKKERLSKALEAAKRRNGDL